MKITNKQVTIAAVNDNSRYVKLAKHSQDFQAALDKFIEDARHDLIMIDNTCHWELKSVSIDIDHWSNGIDIDITWEEYKGEPDNFCIKDAYPSADGIMYMPQVFGTKIHGVNIKMTSIVHYKWTPAEYSFWSDLGIIHHQTSEASTYKTMSCSL